MPAVALIVVGLLGGCSGGGDDAVSVPSTAERDVAVTDELFTERDADGVVESIQPVVETGVPGIDSDDAFCRAWSRYAGSVQAISLAWALQTPVDAARLEVAATDALSEAVDSMSADLPAEIEANRQALTVDVPGPFLRRADRARVLLIDAGLGEEQIADLGSAWVAAITEQGIESETLSIDVAPDAADALEAATGAFVDELPSVNEDPTLDTTEFDISPSLDYIFDTCPDRGTLAGNDVVAGG